MVVTIISDLVITSYTAEQDITYVLTVCTLDDAILRSAALDWIFDL